MKQTMLSAVKPNHYLTLGNYLGAIRNWVKMQADYKCIYFAVDLHSITVRQDPEVLREGTYRAIAVYLAAGLDPQNCLFFVQSHVPEHAQLSWILNCFAYMGELNRMTQFKDKSTQAGKNIPVGLFTYPVLMAADILLYDTHQVPTGADQKQHIELTRDLALRINHYYQKDLFQIPEPMIPRVGGRIMDLQNPERKMGKSDSSENGAVYVFDSDKQIEKKIKRAVTDSGSEITWDPQKPGVQNLLTIQSALSGRSPEELVESYEGKQYGHLKVDTAQEVVATLGPLRDEAQRLLQDRGELDRILKEGAQKARALAGPKVEEVQKTMGFVTPRLDFANAP